MTRNEILETARTCVCGKRETDYGSPEDNFRKIALLWTAYLGRSVTPIDVAMMMVLLKVARTKGGVGSDDNFVDIAGYAACAGELFGNIRTPEFAKPEGTMTCSKDGMVMTGGTVSAP